MKLSIIVPIYNVERYLRKCVDSLLNQNLPSNEYEILLIDDGSTDDSGRIADCYAGQNQNISVIHQNNLGLSCARNTGISKAQGNYIQFVDSDDYLEPNILKAMVDKMDNDNLDVLRFDYQNVNVKGEIFQPYKNPKAFVILSDEICSGTVFLTERLGYACYAWQFVVRTSVIIDNNLFFTEGILFEDTDWTPKLLNVAGRVTSINTVVYNYLSRSGSITQAVSYEHHRQVIESKIRLIKLLLDQSRNVHDKRWYNGMIASTTLSALSLISTYFYDRRKEYIHQIKSMDIFPLSVFNMTSWSARKIDFINISAELFCFCYHLKNRSCPPPKKNIK